MQLSEESKEEKYVRGSGFRRQDVCSIAGVLKGIWEGPMDGWMDGWHGMAVLPR
ncbi:hypothetical protein MBM_03208 [Drepanopeziza brunnea f. sp. 'multigermtubi' MB_m1]|uniref:Uncharacterized protein n=1 Tax=Marssonina brunnea f. sp. multigermtubi (strain MB_m1) TaxID=1072389 RepID=K1X156_MARBU|nr:uncharacterized protein MBM_03208 [Drepanopeziza brunnea f. sp. 'multigermtubi' MB_m1]EKD18966.1 hypothetical protein MBM_03208 [Drepanopeziza brunnea f. sp. 'multigermtubi' MB_m1]